MTLKLGDSVVREWAHCFERSERTLLGRGRPAWKATKGAAEDFRPPFGAMFIRFAPIQLREPSEDERVRWISHRSAYRSTRPGRQGHPEWSPDTTPIPPLVAVCYLAKEEAPKSELFAGSA